MFFAISVLFYSFLFLLGLESTIFNGNVFNVSAVFFILFSLAGVKKIGKKWIYLNTFLVFSISSFTLLYLIDSFFEKQVFIIFSSAFYYLGLLGVYRLGGYVKDQTARGMISASSMAAIFFFYSSVYGIYVNFIVPLWILMTLYFFATIIISYQYFRIIKNESRVVWSYCTVIGLAMAEVAWIINFWPFGYLTTGVIALMLYYVFWDLTQSYFLNLLSKRRLTANLILFSILIGIVLISSRWMPAV